MGYCAAKDLKYFGKNFTVTSASVDERDVVPELTQSLQGHLIADKGLIRPELKQQLASGGLYLPTPLRQNMTELIQSVVSLISNFLPKTL